LGDIDSFLKHSEILIIDIPPKLRGNSKENFVQKIRNLIPFIEASTVQKVLFISSTSVYADDNAVVSESAKPQPDSESGRQLLATEYLLQKHSHFKTTVVRFGGLIGENRHPIHFLAGKTSIENPEAPINLIHLSDCIGIIEKIIDANCFGETFHGVAPFHPTRKAYYTQKAIELKLPLPQFTEEKPSVGKTIVSDKVQTVLKYTFLNTNL
jgi:nucleoside-diphosphate-sugar epimerase